MYVHDVAAHCSCRMLYTCGSHPPKTTQKKTRRCAVFSFLQGRPPKQGRGAVLQPVLRLDRFAARPVRLRVMPSPPPLDTPPPGRFVLVFQPPIVTLGGIITITQYPRTRSPPVGTSPGESPGRQPSYRHASRSAGTGRILPSLPRFPGARSTVLLSPHGNTQVAARQSCV